MPEFEWTAENSVGPGWKDLVQPLIDRAKAEGRTIQQIKKKFGGLRFYYAPFDEAFDKAVLDAERRSYRTCEECGAPGHQRNDGWIRTLCDAHAEAHAKRLAEET